MLTANKQLLTNIESDSLSIVAARWALRNQVGDRHMVRLFHELAEAVNNQPFFNEMKLLAANYRHALHAVIETQSKSCGCCPEGCVCAEHSFDEEVQTCRAHGG